MTRANNYFDPKKDTVKRWKIIVILLLFFSAYTITFIVDYGWIFGVIITILLVIFMFLPWGGSVYTATKKFFYNSRELKYREKYHDFQVEKKLQEERLMKLENVIYKKNAKVAVGLSGGVDSSVTAFLLQKQGYDVVAFFMRNWDSEANGELLYPISNDEDVCSQEKDYQDAKKIAEKLNIPLIKVNFVKEYWDLVFNTFLQEMESGKTPNPDILCNRFIKFDKFTDYIFQNYPDIDYIATGHYANVKKDEDDNYYLTLAKDTNKDQTYFLAEIKREILKKVMFPLSDLTKSEVRKIAKENDLITHNKKDSTGICFIGERDFAKFIKNFFDENPGDIIDKETHKIVGNHSGVNFYTIGQRRNLGLSGFEKPYFVCGKDNKKNILYVTNNEEQLYGTKIKVNDFKSLINFDIVFDEVKIKTRHSPTFFNAKITKAHNLKDRILLEIEALEPIKAITPGQEVVVYKDDICLGGGQISSW